MANSIVHLPKTAKNGLEVCDAYGSIWKYDSQTNSWTNVGTINTSPIVTTSSDGLVSPDIFTRINAISTAVQDGLVFDPLKIYPHLAGYYYFFQSSNHTITFEPESASDLRIEVNRAKLLALLSQLKCPGDQGLIGLRGDAGADGSPGTPETSHNVLIENSRLVVDVPVNNSLGTPLSLRVFSNNAASPTATIIITGSEFVVQQSTIAIDLSATFFDYSGGQLVGQITSSQWGSASWSYKVSQMGRKGPTGGKGNYFIEVVSDSIADTNLVSNRAIILLRQGDNSRSINYFDDVLFNSNCVSKLAISHICSTTTTSLSNSFAALQVTTDSCKNITRYTVQPVTDTIPKLVFAEWTPTGTCLRQRHYAASKLSWPDFTRVGSDMMPWQKANLDVAADPSYPWSIIEESTPGEMCCQEDFFFCSNVNDITGACPVTIVTPPQTPSSQAFGCDCDCPISFLLEGGYEFEDTTIRGAGDQTSQVAVCSVNGGLHEYSAAVNVSTNSAIIVTVTWKLEYDSICDDARALYQSQINTIPGFKADPREAVSQKNCPIAWTIIDETIPTPSLARQICSSPQVLPTTGTMSYRFKCSSGTIITSAQINTNRLDCCLGYKLSVLVTANSLTSATDIVCAELDTLSPSPSPSLSISPSLSVSPSPSSSLSPSPSPSLSPSTQLSVSPSLSPSQSVLSLSPSLSQSQYSLSPSPSQSQYSLSPSLSQSILSLSPSLSQSLEPTPDFVVTSYEPGSRGVVACAGDYVYAGEYTAPAIGAHPAVTSSYYRRTDNAYFIFWAQDSLDDPSETPKMRHYWIATALGDCTTAWRMSGYDDYGPPVLPIYSDPPSRMYFCYGTGGFTVAPAGRVQTSGVAIVSAYVTSPSPSPSQSILSLSPSPSILSPSLSQSILSPSLSQSILSPSPSQSVLSPSPSPSIGGSNIWVSQYGNSSYSKFFKVTQAGAVTEYDNGAPHARCIAYDGTNMWSAGENQVTKITPSGSASIYSITGTNTCRNMAFDGTNMWIVGMYNEYVISKINPSGSCTTYPLGAYNYANTVAFDGTYMWAGGGGDDNAMTFDGSNIWFASNSNFRLYTFPVSTGGSVGYGTGALRISLSGSVAIPGSGGTNYLLPGAPTSMTFDGANNWVCIPNMNIIVKVTPAGAMTSYATSKSYPYHICFDGTNLWVAHKATPWISVFSTTGTELHSYSIVTENNFLSIAAERLITPLG